MQVGTRTHVGRVRSNNEDGYFVRSPVLAVADGMGGHAAGEVASKMMLDALADAAASEFPPEEVPDRLRRAVVTAHKRMAAAVKGDETLKGMGTTVTAAFVAPSTVHIAHVGDSRAYLWRDGELRQLTTDHSIAAELVRAGQLDEREAGRHPHRHVLTRAVSAHKAPEVDMIHTDLPPDSVLLLCTDGLTAHVDDDVIADVLQREDDVQRMADQLVRFALQGGGSDNVTVVVARRKLPEVVR